MNSFLLFAFLNFALCVPSIFICICRLNSMTPDVLLRVRVEYVTGTTALLVSALQPWWGEWPRWGSICLSGYVLVALLSSSRAWRHDDPPEIATDPAPLEVSR